MRCYRGENRPYKCPTTLDKEQANLEKEDIFNKENIGIFWGLMETRPYMRTKHSYMLTLMELGRYTEAIKQSDDSTFMLFPLSIMYYKKGDYKKAKKILKKIKENNEYILEYLKQKIKFTKTKIENIEYEGTYSWGSEAEAFFVVKDYKYLLETAPTFIEFVEREIE